MPTGACGINCDVCRLKVQGEGFLKMQERRRSQAGQAIDPTKEKIKVPPEYWEDLKRKDFATVCRNALATDHAPEGFLLRFLGETILIDMQKSVLKIGRQGAWEKMSYPLLELLSLVYLLNAGPEGLRNEMVSVQQLKTSHFFQGPHELNLDPLIRRFGNDVEGFKDAGLKIGGEPQDLADASFKILAFPKVPLYYLLWRGDEEFNPRLSVLFDRSVENHLSADAIWGLVSLVSDALLKGPISLESNFS